MGGKILKINKRAARLFGTIEYRQYVSKAAIKFLNLEVWDSNRLWVSLGLFTESPEFRIPEASHLASFNNGSD